MKIFQLIIIFFVQISLFAQISNSTGFFNNDKIKNQISQTKLSNSNFTIRMDSMVFNSYFDEWIKWKLSFEYQNNNMIADYGYNWNNNQWVLGLEELFTYNDGNKLTSSEHHSYYNNQWHNEGRVEFEYDGDGNNIIIRDLNFTNNVWVTSREIFKTYNSSNQISEKIHVYYPFNSNAEYLKKSYTYNSSGFVSQIDLSYQSNSVWTVFKTWYYNYNSDENLISILVYNNASEIIESEYRTYDLQGNCIIQQIIDENQNHQNLFEYDTQGNVIVKTKGYQTAINQYETDNIYHYFYNTNGLYENVSPTPDLQEVNDEFYLIESPRINQFFNIPIQVLTECSYYPEMEYCEIEDIYYNLSTVSLTENQDLEITLNPNPITGSLTISGLQDIQHAEIIIFDIKGNQILKTNYLGYPIDLSQLDSGIYILKLNNNSSNIVRKIIKD